MSLSHENGKPWYLQYSSASPRQVKTVSFLSRRESRLSCVVSRDDSLVSRDENPVSREGGNLLLSGIVDLDFEPKFLI